MFTYFYNKFSPVNRIHYIKCGVNSSLHNSGCCIWSVAAWITVLSRHTVFTKRVIYYKFTFVRYFVKQGTTHRPTSYLAHSLPFVWPRQEHRRQSRWVGDFAGQCLLWRLLLRLAAAAVVVPLILPPKNSLPYRYPPHQIPEVGVSNENYTVGFPLKFFFRPFLDAHNRLPCVDCYVWLRTVAET